MINTRINQLEQDIVKVINEANLPPAIIELVLNKVTRVVEQLTVQSINKEMIEAQEKEEMAEDSK